MTAWAVILAGGSGTRFWPLSTPKIPKQMLTLAGSDPLLRQAVDRLSGLIPPERILILTGSALEDDTRKMLPDIPRENILIEPRAASTAPALVWATYETSVRDSEAVILSLHADWFVGDDQKFRETAELALDAARERNMLVTVGMVPSRPDTGYGYIQKGERLDEKVHLVKQFKEKPDLETARNLIDEGALWNSGLFAWPAKLFLEETERVAPEIAPHLDLLRKGSLEQFFSSVTPIAVDHSHFERSESVAVVPGAFPWDDVGTWNALSRVRPTDENQNVIEGKVHALDAKNCVLWADDGTLVVDGVSDLVVVRANGATLVTTRDRAQDLKAILNKLPPETVALSDDQKIR